MRTYYEATEAVRVLVPGLWRECQWTNYDSRRTGNWFLDTGSNPVCSTQKV